MKVNRTVFISKYLNKKHSVSSLFVISTLFFALALILLLLILLSGIPEINQRNFILAAIMPGIIIFILSGWIIWSEKTATTPLKNELVSEKDINKNLLDDLQNESKYFSRVLSHDLRSPLSSIVLLASYLKSKNEQSENNHYLELIEQSARKELDMMTLLLSLMRMDSMNPENVKEVFIRQTTETLLREAEPQLLLKHINPVIIIPSGLSILTDPEVFALVLKNLIQKAINYSDPQQTMEITAKDNEAKVIIQIEFKSTAFGTEEPRHLLSSDHLESQKEIKSFPESIGLYFCSKLISNHNGTIDVQGDKNERSFRFILTLDRHTPHTA